MKCTKCSAQIEPGDVFCNQCGAQLGEDFLIENGVLKQYRGNERDLIIPHSVTEIAPMVFAQKDLRQITLPKGLKQIGHHAFAETGLKTMTLPASVRTIGEGAFYGCRSLETVDVNAGTEQIGNAAFFDCISLKKITIPNSVKGIGEMAFQGCSSLTQLYLPDSVQKIGQAACINCTNLKTVHIPEGLQSIPANMFECCKSLTKITVPGCVTIGAGALLNCVSLMDVQLPSCLKRIEKAAFSGCSRLIRVRYDSSRADRDAISIASGNEPLTDAALWEFMSDEADAPANPENAKKQTGVSDKAAQCCKCGAFIDPEEVFCHSCSAQIMRPGASRCGEPIRQEKTSGVLAQKQFGHMAAGICMIVGLAVWILLTAFDNEMYRKLKNGVAVIWLILTAAALLGTIITGIAGRVRKRKTPLTFFLVICLLMSIGSGVVIASVPHMVIRDNTLTYYSYLCLRSTADIPEGVTEIGEKAFFGTDVLRVRIPQSVASIAPDAFEACSGLRYFNVDFRNAHFVIDNHNDGGIDVLYSSDLHTLVRFPPGNRAHRSFTVPDGVTRIAPRAFSGCDRLTKIILPESLREIGANAFRSCFDLEAVLYGGNELQRAQITVGEENDCLMRADWEYNAAAE